MKEPLDPTTGVRRFHRILGVVLVLPILLWAGTGLLFHLKPGWGPAYAGLALPCEPIAGTLVFPEQAGWLEARRLRTVLGEHLLVRTSAGWQHLDANTREPFPEPAVERQRELVERALADGGARYGELIGREDGAFLTSSGVRVELDWQTLTLSQRGQDTDLIDALYRIHYLQWTGIPALDQPFALLGLVALAVLALVGLRLARPRRER